MTLHVGLFGTGSWGRVHLEALQQSPHVARVTLCGRHPARLTEWAATCSKVVATAATLEQLCSQPSIDLIDIVVPHDLHASAASAALAAGKHVICEKPAALTLAQFDTVAAAADRAGRRLLVVMNQLYNPRFEAVRAVVADGCLGRPFLLVENAYSRHVGGYHDPQAWRTRVIRAGGGVLIDGGFHMVYKQLELLRAAGEPRWVVADTAQLNLAPRGRGQPDMGEDFVQYTVGFDGALRIAGSHAWTLPATISRPREGFLAGEEGVLEMPDGFDGAVALRTSEGLRELPLPEALHDPRPESMRRCLDDYLGAIREERRPQYGSRELARQTLAVILGAYESARCGRRVDLS